MKNKLFASVPNILFGALITIAPQTFAHACTGHDMPGACHYSQQAATGIGVVILVFGVVALFVAPQIRIGLNIAAAADALLLLAVPTFLIGICKGAMMHCRMVMLPTLIVLGVLTIVFAAIAIWLDSRAAKRTDRADGRSPAIPNAGLRPRLLQPHYKQHKDSSCHPISHCAAFRLKPQTQASSAPAHCSPSSPSSR